MIPVSGNAVWGGLNVVVSELAVRPPPHLWIREGRRTCHERKTPPATKSDRGSIWGSIWGGGAKGEGSVRDYASVLKEIIPVGPPEGKPVNPGIKG